MRLITPKRLKENEDFMWQFADRLIDGFLDEGSCEMVGAYAEPFTLTVIADLEGVPESDHSLFRERLSTVHQQDVGHKPLEFLYERFTEYIEDRRRDPRNDVLTGLATATFPDGSTPEVKDAALIAANLFAGGQETTVRLLSFALRMLGERPDLQQLVRADRDRIPNFIEETLRLESPLRTQFRMARVADQLWAVSTSRPGPRSCSSPARATGTPGCSTIPTSSTSTGRTRASTSPSASASTPVREHRSPGPRAGSRINRFLDRTSDISISEEHHGPAGARHYEYLPTFFLRGLQRLNLEFTPGRLSPWHGPPVTIRWAAPRPPAAAAST